MPSPTATLSPTPLPAADTQVSIDLSMPGPLTQVALSTNVDTWTELTPPSTSAAQASLGVLQTWNPPLVRLHFGFREDQPVLPEATPGQWDFQRLDDAISQLRARNISFVLNVRHAPPWMYDSVGQLPDQNFPAFATYMARLVGWYNAGGFTDDLGVFHASGHEHWVPTWEVWNEPKSGAEIPGPVPDRRAAPWMTAERFARLYDQSVEAMRAVDPTIQTGGPALGSYPDNDYLRTFVANEHAPLDFFSFHFYAATDPQEPDAQVLGAVTGDRFLQRVIANRQMLDQLRPGQHIPIWIDEVGFNEIAHAPFDLRGAEPISYAFVADTFINAEQQGVAMLDQFHILGNAQLGLLDINSLQPYRQYWFYRLLAQLFPPGLTLYPVSVSGSGGALIALAALTPDRQSLRILVANLQVAHAADVNGSGVPHTVRLVVYTAGLGPAQLPATLWQLDATAPSQASPVSTTLHIIAFDHGTFEAQVSLKGYGAALLSIQLGSAVTSR